MFDIPEEHCFLSVQDLVSVQKFADAVINGTMDKQHVVTTVPLLEHGYDVLLEKPFAINERQAKVLLDCAKKTGRKVMVCHVLRYSPFYTKIKEVVDSGEIGKIINTYKFLLPTKTDKKHIRAKRTIKYTYYAQYTK